MKTVIVSLMMLGASGVGAHALMDGEKAGAPPVQVQQDTQGSADAEELYNLVQLARAELRATRASAGLRADATAPQAGRPEGHERSEGGEARGEHGAEEGSAKGDEHGGRGRGGRGEGGEEGGAYLAKMARQSDLFANGARLVLQFNPNTQVFVGSVTNTTAETLAQVRVEIHLDNGTELGPTKRVDVDPGQTIPVELGAFGNQFSAWVSHPEAGAEQGHGHGGEEGGEGPGEHGGPEGRGEQSGEVRGEHGGEARGERGGQVRSEHGGEAHGGEAGEQGAHGSGVEGTRPRDLAYRPLYNQLQILRGEVHAFEVELKLGRATP